MSVVYTAKSDELPDEHARIVESLLSEPAPTSGEGPPGGGADRFQYDLTVDDGERSRTFRWGESEVPDDVRPVLSELSRMATPARGT
jgi:hypothetical protein